METEKLGQRMLSGEFLPKVKEAFEILRNWAEEDKDNRGIIVLACDWSVDECPGIISSCVTRDDMAMLFSLLLKDQDVRKALTIALLVDGLNDVVGKTRNDESENSKGDFECDETPQPQEDRDFTRDETPQRKNFSSNS